MRHILIIFHTFKYLIHRSQVSKNKVRDTFPLLTLKTLYDLNTPSFSPVNHLNDYQLKSKAQTTDGVSLFITSEKHHFRKCLDMKTF